MLREMDFIATDWSAVCWALGSTIAICRYSLLEGIKSWAQSRRGRSKAHLLRAFGRSVGGLAAGVLFCVCVLAACIFSLTRVSPWLFPEWHLAQMPWAQCLSVLGMPEIIFVIAAVALWRRRKTMSAGILVGAITLFTHFVMYVSTHR